MLATIASKPFVIVLLDSAGKYTRLGDAQRVRHWLETGQTLPAIAEAKPAAKTNAKTKPVADKHPAKRRSSRA
jgi:D-alanyl-D-alanine endopeptidase (penicillin-binding protein 7)